MLFLLLPRLPRSGALRVVLHRWVLAVVFGECVHRFRFGLAWFRKEYFGLFFFVFFIFSLFFLSFFLF